MAKPILLLCGIPGAGKSTFGRWLEESKHFKHLDMEMDGLDCTSIAGPNVKSKLAMHVIKHSGRPVKCNRSGHPRLSFLWRSCGPSEELAGLGSWSAYRLGL